MKWFITYGDNKFKEAKERILRQAKDTGEFDKIVAYGKENVSIELRQSEIFKIPRGGGLWSWKPDVIWTTMKNAKDGDIIVYCDSGCTLQKSKEWKWYWKKLENYNIIAQRIIQRTDHWTRKEILEMFKENGKHWSYCYQFQATIVLLVGDFTRMFIKEWRDLMLHHSLLAMDVTPQERYIQHPTFKENRHDQAIYSALIYKYLRKLEYRDKIYPCWERIEDCSILYRQAVRATRLRYGECESRKKKLKSVYKRIIKHYLLIPLIYVPLQWWHSR